MQPPWIGLAESRLALQLGVDISKGGCRSRCKAYVINDYHSQRARVLAKKGHKVFNVHISIIDVKLFKRGNCP